jgi:hypothetical protein
MQLLGIGGSDRLCLSHLGCVEEALGIDEKIRETRWSESVAVGDLSFVKNVETELGARAFGRNTISSAGGHELREYQVSYNDHFPLKNTALSHGNGLLWRVYDEIPI